MEHNISELKEAIERIEEKLMSASKIYSAIQFQVWLILMMLYYIIIGLLKAVPWQLTAVYWISAITIFGYASMKILERLKKLLKSYGKSVNDSRYFGIAMVLSWIMGAIIGWSIVPSALLNAGVDVNMAVAIGFLSFISISVFGMFLTFLYFADSFEKEMIPAFVIPSLSIMLMGRVTIESMVYAGFSIGLGYSLTVLAYLYTTFKALR